MEWHLLRDLRPDHGAIETLGPRATLPVASTPRTTRETKDCIRKLKRILTFKVRTLHIFVTYFTYENFSVDLTYVRTVNQGEVLKKNDFATHSMWRIAEREAVCCVDVC